MLRKLLCLAAAGVAGTFALACERSDGPVATETVSELSPAATTCSFTTTGSTMELDGDCTTDETILVPDGFTLDGGGHTITAEDPPGDHFRGAVIANDGSTAHVTKVTVTASGLVNACDNGADRLRGIMFDGASGSITQTTGLGINQGLSGCQEGNAIEVRNAPFDGTHPDTQTVEISHNVVEDYQKTGIVANGDVDVSVAHNQVGASATQENLAANSVQLGFGALGSVSQNQIEGNQWKGTSNFAASAILTFAADAPIVDRNIVRGNSDIGIFHIGDDATIDNNKVFDEGADHMNSCCDIGIGAFGGENNTVTNNKVRGFDVPFAGFDEGDNKSIPSPSN